MRLIIPYLLSYVLLLAPLQMNVTAQPFFPRLKPPVSQSQKNMSHSPATIGITGDDYMHGIFDGRRSAALNHKSGKWAGSGFAGGVFLGIIGAGIIMASSRSGNSEPTGTELLRISNQPSEYQIGFMEGYHKTARSRNYDDATTGAVAGIATLGGMILLITLMYGNH